MRFLVKAEVFHSLSGPEDVKRIRKKFSERVKKIMDSGKLTFGGVSADARGLFMILEVDSEIELITLLGGTILDHTAVETHPIISFEQFLSLLEEYPGSGS